MKRLTYILLLLMAVLPLAAAEPMDTIQLAAMMENSQFEDVVRLTGRELQRFPRSGAMYYYRGMALANQGMLPEAMEDISRAIRYPKDVPMTLPDLYVLRSGMYILIDDTASAINDCSTAIRLANKHARTARYYTRRARTYAYFERYEEAADDYRTACDIEPHNPTLQLELARYLALSDHTPQARQLLEDLSALHPEQVEAPYLLAVLLCYVEEEYNASVDWLITSLTRRFLADRSVGDTDILFLAGAIDYAYVYRALSDEISRYKAQEQYGLRDLFYLLRSRLLRQRGYFEDALADLDSVSVFSFPRAYEPTIDRERLQCHVRLCHWQQVIDLTTTFIRQQPDTSPYYGLRGTAYYELEQSAAAEADLLRADELYPSVQTALMLGLYYNRNSRYDRVADYMTAALSYEGSSDEELAYIYLTRGQARLLLGDTAAAYRDLEQVLRLDTTYRNTVRHYALYRLGRTREALAWVERLLREYPEADNYYDAACLYALEGQTDRALQLLETALRWGYDHPRQLLYDHDLDGLRTLNDYHMLVGRYVPSLQPTQKPAAKPAQKPTSKTKKK